MQQPPAHSSCLWCSLTHLGAVISIFQMKAYNRFIYITPRYLFDATSRLVGAMYLAKQKSRTTIEAVATITVCQINSDVEIMGIEN